MSLNLHFTAQFDYCFYYLHLYLSVNNFFYFVCFSRQKLASGRQSCPRSDDKSGQNMNAYPPLDVSRDYILFSPSRLAAATKKAKLQQSLQNQSASVLTVPSGLDLSTLSDTLPQPGEIIEVVANIF